MPRAAADRLNLRLESTGDGIFGIDMDGCCTFINRAAAQTLGWRTEQVLGRNVHALIHHSHAGGRHDPESACPIFNAFRQGPPCRIDDVLWRADGSCFRAEYAGHPIVECGEVRSTFVDITERKRAPGHRADPCRRARRHAARHRDAAARRPGLAAPDPQRAAGYLSRSADAEQLTEAIRKVALCQRFVTPSVAEMLAGALTLSAAGEAPLHERLSHRERQVFRLLSQGRSVGEIALVLAPHGQHLPRPHP